MALNDIRAMAASSGEAPVAKLESALAAFSEAELAILGSGALERLCVCFRSLGYDPDTEFQQFVWDVSELGVDKATTKLTNQGMREEATFKAFLRIVARQAWFPRIANGPTEVACLPGVSASDTVVHLGKLLSASLAGDKSKVETLADELDPSIELRELVRRAKIGEPLRATELDNDLLREGANATKGKRFIRSSEAKIEDIAKLKRPLASVLLSTLPKLWAAVLHQRCTPGDALNWVAQVALVANDASVSDQKLAEKSSAVYGTRLFQEAYQVSKMGEDDAQGRQNVADAFATIDWGLAGRITKELADTHDDAHRIYLKGLFGKCSYRDCTYAHRCPFHATSRDSAFQCFCSDVAAHGWQMVKQEASSGSNGKGAGYFKGAGRGKTTYRRDDRDRRSHSRSRKGPY